MNGKNRHGNKPQKRDSQPSPRRDGHQAQRRDSQPQKRDGHRPPRREGRSSPLTPHEYFVEGKSSVLEYVRFRPDAVIEVYATKSNKQECDGLLSDLKKLGFNGPISDVQLVKEDHRISSPIAAKVMLKSLEYAAFEKRIAAREEDLILVLDHIEDPRNFGAIVRSAAFFGVKEIIVPDRRQVLITQSAVGTAQGGFAVCDIVCVSNLVRTVESLKKDASYWVIGADMNGESCSVLVGEYKKVLLVLGNEGSGLSRMMREACDRIAMIQGVPDGLDSLNVSVAAGILLSAFSQPRLASR